MAVKKLNETFKYYPHSEGLTRVEYSPSGKYAVTIGGDGFAKRYKMGSEEEPKTVDLNTEDLVNLSVTDELFVTCSKECKVEMFDLEQMTPMSTVLRTTLPLNDVVFSPDGKWIAACSDDNEVKLVESMDTLNTFSLPDHPAGVKHLGFDSQGLYLSTTCQDGTIRVYSMSSQSPTLKGELAGIVPVYDEEAYCGVAWHPSGASFVVQTKSRELAQFEFRDGSYMESGRFVDTTEQGHTGSLTAVQFCGNGRYLASTDTTKLNVWDVASKTLVASWHGAPRGDLCSVAWDPSKDSVSFATKSGVMFAIDDPVAGTNGPLTAQEEPNTNKENEKPVKSKEELFGEDSDMDLDDFVEDDDNAGYMEPVVESNNPKKRGFEYVGESVSQKRAKFDQQPAIHSGSTPWRNSRRYLCMNQVGYVWAVSQPNHNTVTVTFHDRGHGTEYHFTDENESTMASLSSEACLLASTEVATVKFHRGQGVDNWEYAVSKSDAIRAVSLSDTMVVICTEQGYVRVFNLTGTPVTVYRQVRDPVVAIASYRNEVMIVRTNAIGQLSCTIDNPKLGQVYVKDEPVDVAHDGELHAVFFSEQGDPCIYDDRGVLLVLSQWREPLQSRWVPLLDTTTIAPDSQRSYWPIGLVNNQLNAIIIKGKERYPAIPLANFEVFDLSVPVDSDKVNLSPTEHSYVTQKALYELLPEPDQGLRTELDKLLLQQLNAACATKNSAKPLGIVHQFSINDQILSAARQVALRHDAVRLAERIDEYKQKVL